MQASGKASAVIALILVTAAGVLLLVGLAINRAVTGEWWPTHFADPVLISFAVAGFFAFMAVFFVVAVLVSFASPILTRQISPRNDATQIFRAGWRTFERVHLVFASCALAVIVGVVMLAAFQEILVAAILLATLIIGFVVALWWNRRERRPV
jgi:hypothetical protein